MCAWVADTIRARRLPVAELTYDTRIGYSKGALTPIYWAVMKVEQAFLAVFRSRRTFKYHGVELPYVRAMYNRTWATERCIEVAIARKELAEAEGKAILEVGNVLWHYGDRGQTVVDKYEVAEGVRNIDIVDLGDDETFDLILSISTMEHVGWDETPREPEKFLAAYKRLVAALNPGGKLVVTVPVEWNEWLDAALANDEIPADHIDWYERTGLYCSWRESDKATTLAKHYGKPHGNANGLVVLTNTRADD